MTLMEKLLYEGRCLYIDNWYSEYFDNWKSNGRGCVQLISIVRLAVFRIQVAHARPYPHRSDGPALRVVVGRERPQLNLARRRARHQPMATDCMRASGV